MFVVPVPVEEPDDALEADGVQGGAGLVETYDVVRWVASSNILTYTYTYIYIYRERER